MLFACYVSIILCSKAFLGDLFVLSLRKHKNTGIDLFFEKMEITTRLGNKIDFNAQDGFLYKDKIELYGYADCSFEKSYQNGGEFSMYYFLEANSHFTYEKDTIKPSELFTFGSKEDYKFNFASNTSLTFSKKRRTLNEKILEICRSNIVDLKKLDFTFDVEIECPNLYYFDNKEEGLSALKIFFKKLLQLDFGFKDLNIFEEIVNCEFIFTKEYFMSEINNDKLLYNAVLDIFNLLNVYFLKKAPISLNHQDILEIETLTVYRSIIINLSYFNFAKPKDIEPFAVYCQSTTHTKKIQGCVKLGNYLVIKMHNLKSEPIKFIRIKHGQLDGLWEDIRVDHFFENFSK